MRATTAFAAGTHLHFESQNFGKRGPGDVRISMPRLVAPGKPLLERSFNDSIAKRIGADYQEYTRTFAGTDKDMQQHLLLHWSFETIENDGRYASVLLSRYIFEGGAHGLGTFVAINVDVQAQSQLNLADLFAKESAYLPRLAKLSRPRLEKLTFEEGLLPKEENFSTFLITPPGLRIIFQVYQIAPYVSGPSDITIPWDELRDVLSPQALEYVTANRHRVATWSKHTVN